GELGRRCLLFTIGGDLGVVEALGLELVDTPEQADFLFLTGTEIPPLTLDDYHAILERAARRSLPMVCSNPDHVAPSGTELVIAPGTIAAMYEAMGGTVRYIGKPHAPIYGACLDALEGLELGEIVAVGDSLEHDIKGANNVGIASCFLTGGIHAGEFPPDATPAEHERQLAELGRQHAASPDWVVPRLTW
ncbi:MAG: HAD hydrolase-like protein, partial [Myxococcota bacterium]